MTPPIRLHPIALDRFNRKREAIIAAAQPLNFADDSDGITEAWLTLLEAVDAACPTPAISDAVSDTRFEHERAVEDRRYRHIERDYARGAM